MIYEKRCLVNKKAQFKTRDEETNKKYISGYFAVFDDIYEMWPGGTESIDKDAFRNTINDDIRCLADHDTRIVLGRTKSGTFNLKVDDKGLWGEVEINPFDQEAVNLYERVKRGDVDQCSIGFEVIKEESVYNEDSTHWNLEEVKLYECSIVTFPAYEKTEVSARKKQVKDIRKKQNETFRNDMIKKLKGE